MKSLILIFIFLSIIMEKDHVASVILFAIGTWLFFKDKHEVS